MNNNIDKIIICGLISIFVLYIYYNAKDNNSDMYHIDNKPYKICNKNIYITDYTYNNNLDTQELFKEIECICNNNC